MRNIGIAVVLLVGVWTVGMVNVEAKTVTIVDRCDPAASRILMEESLLRNLASS